MRYLMIPLATILCTGCTLTPYEIQKAPLKPDQAVVFDIDGTLTPQPSAIYTAREGAASSVQRFADRGYKVIYLSARHVLFQHNIPNWLKKNHFPEGSIHVPQSGQESRDPAAFKAAVLARYQAQGWHFVAAFGDSSTDFAAYAQAGIPQSKVYALQRAGATACQPGVWAQCLDSWATHQDIMRSLAQP